MAYLEEVTKEYAHQNGIKLSEARAITESNKYIDFVFNSSHEPAYMTARKLRRKVQKG